ncbi:JmjC domain-containing protein [Tanacetum coccineum]|uniref:JmjC domain-containing protein n=1 Tax=Tanacetum coccineum TaxID=301880 RepID=A0ABQ5BLF6_9ASTR
MLLDFNDNAEYTDEEIEEQTLDGKARAWFDNLPPGSIDNWGDFQEKFLNRFGMLRACAKDPTKISKIIRRANESLPHFKERWVSESKAIPSVSELMQISSFMNSHKCPELSKHFSDSIPKTVDEMLKRVDDYVRSEEAFRDTELPRGEFQWREGSTPRALRGATPSSAKLSPAKRTSQRQQSGADFRLTGRKRKFVMTESDIEEEEEHDVDPLIKLAKAAATAVDDSVVPTGGSNEDDIPPSSSIPSDAFAGGSAIPPDVTTGPTDAPSDKGKSPMLEEEPPVRERSFRQREEDRLGAEAARRLYEEEQAELAREREEQKQKRQKDVLESAKYYTDADWNEIMGQVHANQGLSADLLGPDVNEDNFAARMVALIAERRRKFAAQRFQDKRNKPMTYAQQRDYMRTFVKNQSSTIYTTGWTMKHVRSFSDDQLKDEFDKIRHALANLQSQHLRRSLKRQGADLEQPDSKKSKSTEPQKTSVPAASRPSSAGVTPDVHQSPFVDTPPATPPHSPKASSHPDVTPDTSKQPSVAPTPPSGFSATPTVTRTSGPRTRNQSSAAGIKTYSTRRKSLGSRKLSSSEVDLNAADTSFIKVLCADDSNDSDGDTNPHYWHAFAAWEIVPTGLSNYAANPIAGAGMMLWGDLHVLFKSVEGGSSVEVWADQKDWVVYSLPTVDKQFPAGSVVPTGKDNSIVSTGSPKVIPAGRTNIIS